MQPVCGLEVIVLMVISDLANILLSSLGTVTSLDKLMAAD